MPVGEKDFRDLSNQVAALKASVGLWGSIVGVATSLACLVGGAALSWCFHINSKVDVLESGGDTKLITQLETPTSEGRLEAALSQVVAQASTARAENKRPNPEKMAALDKAVAGVIQGREVAPNEAWQAASFLVNLRSANNVSAIIPPELARIIGPPIPSMGDCFSYPLPPLTMSGGSVVKPGISTIRLAMHDCTMDIGDVAAYRRSTQQQPGYNNFSLSDLYRYPLVLFLVRVKVTYRGGPVLPIRGIQMYDCSFDFSVFERPAEKGRQLLLAILESEPSTSTYDLVLEG